MNTCARILAAVAFAGMALQPAAALAQAAVAAPGAPGVAPASAAAAASPPAAAPALALDAVVEEALEQNPEIAAMARGFDAMKARVPQAKAWPEPMVEVGWMADVGTDFIKRPPD